MEDSQFVKLHLDYTQGPMEDEEAMMGGEGPWGIPIEDNPCHYEVNNLLFGTLDVGLFDVVRCADIGTYWTDREVVEVVKGHPCWRGIARSPENVEEFMKELRKNFTDDEVQVEGGMGILLFQCEPDKAIHFMDFLDTSGFISEYALEPVNIDDDS